MIIEKPSRTYAWFHDVTTQDIEVNRGEGIGAHKVLAGSPIDANGNVANDETAIGLLMETVSDANPDGKIIVAGDVDALGAKNASGIELSDAAKNALIGITWRDPDYVVEMQAGGGWPADLPKPSVGGYGYTEQGEQTTITWDGDTEGRDVLTIIDSEHPDNVIRMYKVAEYSSKQFTENCELVAVGRQFPVSLYTYDHAEMYAGDSPFAIRTDGTDFDIQSVGTAHAESSGVYFSEMGGAYVESLTYGTPDTVHKIDERYIGGGGGAMVVHFEVVDGDLICNHTYDEIAEAFPNIIVTADDGDITFACPQMFINEGFFCATSIVTYGQGNDLTAIVASQYFVGSDGAVTNEELRREFD